LYDADKGPYRPYDADLTLSPRTHAAPHQDAPYRDRIESSDRLGRYRWVVERTLTWLQHFRRLTVRYERRIDIHEGFLHLGCALICLNYLS